MNLEIQIEISLFENLLGIHSFSSEFKILPFRPSCLSIWTHQYSKMFLSTDISSNTEVQQNQILTLLQNSLISKKKLMYKNQFQLIYFKITMRNNCDNSFKEIKKITLVKMKERVSKLTYPTLQHCLRRLYTMNGNSKH